MDNQQVIDLFSSRGMVDKFLAQDMLQSIEVTGKTIAETLKDFDIIGHKDEIWPVIASELGAEMVDLSDWTPPQELLALLPSGMARLHGALPVNVGPEGLHVCLVDPLNPQAAEDLRFALGREIILAVAPDYIVEEKINECYGGESQAMDDLLGQLDDASSGNPQDAQSEANSAPIIPLCRPRSLSSN